MAQTRDWRIDLIQSHPALFGPAQGFPPRPSGYPWCDGGWLDLLERLCTRIEAALGAGERVRIQQLKEKFASLRCYWSGEVSPATAARIREAVALAEARSACTCEECGDVGRLYRADGVYMTRCAVHAKGAPVPGDDGQATVHAVRLGTAHGIRRAARRYDRETDTFIELPEEK